LWRGSVEERKDKFQLMHDLLNRFYGRNVVLKFQVTEESDKIPGSSGSSCFIHPDHPMEQSEDGIIVMKGRLSVITFLHEWGHAIGCDQQGAQNYSMGLFKIAFPNSYGNLSNHDGLMIRSNEVFDPVLDGDDLPPLE